MLQINVYKGFFFFYLFSLNGLENMASFQKHQFRSEKSA